MKNLKKFGIFLRDFYNEHVCTIWCVWCLTVMYAFCTNVILMALARSEIAAPALSCP